MNQLVVFSKMLCFSTVSAHPTLRKLDSALTPVHLCRCHSQSNNAHSLNKWFRARASILDSSTKARQHVEHFWRLTQEGQFSKTVPLFASDAVLNDALYPSPFSGITAIETHMLNMEKVFPVGKLQFILEDLSASADYKASARWRVETKRTGFVLSSGISWYSMQEMKDGELVFSEVFDVPEPSFKIAPVILPFLGLIATVL